MTKQEVTYENDDGAHAFLPQLVKVLRKPFEVDVVYGEIPPLIKMVYIRILDILGNQTFHKCASVTRKKLQTLNVSPTCIALSSTKPNKNLVIFHYIFPTKFA